MKALYQPMQLIFSEILIEYHLFINLVCEVYFMKQNFFVASFDKESNIMCHAVTKSFVSQVCSHRSIIIFYG